MQQAADAFNLCQYNAREHVKEHLIQENKYFPVPCGVFATLSGTLEIREQCFQRDSYYVDINVVVMHQSIPAAPSPPPPGYRGAFARLVSPGGWGIYKFCTARGPGICQPRGHQRAFDTLAISYQNITTQKVLLEKKQTGSPVKDRNKLKRIVKACSRFYAYISSLLVKPELHSENRNYRCESTCFGY